MHGFIVDNTWNTVSRLCQKLSKLLRGLSAVALKSNRPPNTCIPSRAKITMKRNNSNSSDAMDWMELSSEATRLDKDRQYL